MGSDNLKPVFQDSRQKGRDKAAGQGPGGLYVHVPFCIKKCPYCDFYSITNLSLINAWLPALEKEIGMAAPSPLTFDTLYIGGGTPSVLAAGQIVRIIDTVFKHFNIEKDCEITMEVNPGTVSIHDFRDFYRAGVNRINMGVQSFQDKNLGFLGRIHSAKEAEKALENARGAGFDNVGFDLMYGLPGQTEKEWIKDLSRAVSHKPRHLSCYMLSYEKGTAMDQDRRQGRIMPLPDQSVGKLFETTVEFLQENGISQYEISNYADSPQSRSRHNQKYWHFAPYLGFGPGAHSYVDPQRSWNQRDIHKYLSLLNQGKRPASGREFLNREQQMIESIYLGLRTTGGIDMAWFDDSFETDFMQMFGALGDQLTEQGLVHMAHGRCTLTRPGMLMLDSIAERFVTQVA